MIYLLLAFIALLAGCSQTNIADLINAMGKDPATVCANGVYAGASLNIARTNITNGEVECGANGLKIKSTAVQLGIPAQVTIGQPVTVTPPPK